MRIDRNADSDIKCAGEHDIGCFPGNARKRNQVLHAIGNAAAVCVEDDMCCGDNMRGFSAIKSRGPDLLFKRVLIGPRECGDVGVLFKKRPGNLVYFFIGTLRGQDGCNQQFKRVAMVEFSARMRVGAAQQVHNVACAFFESCGRFISCSHDVILCVGCASSKGTCGAVLSWPGI